MTETTEKQVYRKSFLFKYTKLSFYGYGITFAILLFAKMIGVAKFGYDKLLVDFVWILGSVSFFLMWITRHKRISVSTSNLITSAEFLNWLAIFWYTIFFLDEIRQVALFFSIIVLVFMLSHSNFIMSDRKSVV